MRNKHNKQICLPYLLFVEYSVKLSEINLINFFAKLGEKSFKCQESVGASSLTGKG